MRIDPLRSRWTLRCRDLLRKEQYVTIAVDRAGLAITVRIRGCGTTVVLGPAEVQRLRQHLAEALAALLLFQGGWPSDEDPPKKPPKK